MRKVLLASAAAIALVAAASPQAGAVDVIINGQINEGSQTAVFNLEQAVGTSVSSTAAAIGNSFTLNLQNTHTSGAVKLDSFQVNDASQLALNNLDDLSASVGADGPVSGTALALGNTLSVVGNVDSQGNPISGGDLAALNAVQLNTSYQIAINSVAETTASGDNTAAGTSTFLAAAIGNSAVLAAGAIGNAPAADSLIQANLGPEQLAINVIGDSGSPDTNIYGAISLTAVAIGNTAALTTTGGGALDLDQMVQVNGGWYSDTLGQIAINSISNVGLQPNVGVGTPTPPRFDVSAVTAAIGNTANLTSAGDLNLGEAQQINAPSLGQIAVTQIEDLKGVNNLTLTDAAIGNSLTAAASGGLGLGSVFQLNAPASVGQEADTEISGLDATGAVNLTTAAIGNSLSLTGNSFTGLAGPGGSAYLTQVNLASQLAVTDITQSAIGSLTATTTAIGNAATVTIK